MVRALEGRGGRLTVADGAALSGMPLDRARQTLDGMLATYRSHLAATESGELLYAFGSRLRRRDAEPLRDRLARGARAIWRLFVLMFKLAIVAVLVVYFLVFVALLLGLVFASLSSRDGDRNDRDGSFPLWLLFWILPWDTGYRAPRRRRFTRRRSPKVHQQVFNFVFGPPRPVEEPGAADREILSYIRARRGRLCATDLVALRGLDLERAEQEATRLMCDYDGEPEVTEGGVVLYVFRELRRSAPGGRGEAPPRAGAERLPRGSGWRVAWQREEPRPPLTGNSATADLVIGLVNGFNLLVPLWIAPAAVARLGIGRTGAVTWLVVVPLVFSATFFAVPLGRAVVRAVRDRARRRRNRRRELLRAVFGSSTDLDPQRMSVVDLDDLCRSLAPADPAQRSALRREADALVLELDGDVVLEGGGDQVVFPRLHRELVAVREARARTPEAETSPGAVVFDSERPLEELPEMQPTHGTDPARQH